MIPATPAAAEKLPVRHIVVSNVENRMGDYDVYDSTYATREDAQADAGPGEHVYTLLPPHLAEQWEELRKAEEQLASDMESVLLEGFALRPTAPVFADWRLARSNRIAFEKTNGIGGAA